MIEAAISYRKWSNEVEIWFIERDRDGGTVFKVVDGALQPGERYEKHHPAPAGSIILDYEVLQKLIEAAKEFEKPTPAVIRHLDDAISVRDRLLCLV